MPEKNEKVAEFLKEYEALVKKHNMDFATYPVYLPDENGGFRTVIQSTPVDLSQLPTPSPFTKTS